MSATLATEDILIIETPERVPLHFGLASIGNRFLACAIDHAFQVLAIILMIIAFTVVANYSNVGEQLLNAPKWVRAVLIVIVFLIVSVWLIYQTIVNTPRQSAIGLGLILLGLPVYWLLSKSATKSTRGTNE